MKRTEKLVFESSMFSYDKDSKTFMIDASVLEHHYAGRLDYQFGEWGFHMRSSKTGKTVWFKRDSEVKNNDGDLVAVYFTAEGVDCNLTVFNT